MESPPHERLGQLQAGVNYRHGAANQRAKSSRNAVSPEPGIEPEARDESMTLLGGREEPSKRETAGCNTPEAAVTFEDRPNWALKNLSFRDKVGIWGIILLTLGPILNLAALGVLAFLWSNSQSIRLWQQVILDKWLGTAVAICSDVTKTVTGFGIGIMAAMLAAIELEAFNVALLSSVSLSIMRATTSSGSVFTLLWHQLCAIYTTKRGAGWRNMPFIVSLACIYSVTQFTATLLLSDVGLANIPGFVDTIPMPYGITDPLHNLVGHSISWARTACLYPTFAEYSEPPYVADGVRDTGLTLRAFLPFQRAQDRQDLRGYTGSTTVLDARVTCQVPSLTNVLLSQVLVSEQVFDATFVRLQAQVAASRYTPRLANHTKVTEPVLNIRYNESIPFSCTAMLNGNSSTEWLLSICQLPEGGNHSVAGGLVSEFLDSPPSDEALRDEDMVRIGTAYLAVNITEVGSRDSEVALSPLGYTERGEWLDLVFSNRAVISISLCYSAFSQADIPVHISSNVNRTETIPTFNFATQKYEFHDLRHQMGQPPEGDGDRNSSTPLSPQDRGLLDMHNQSWIATLRDVGIYNNTQMYFRAAVGFDGWNEGNSGNISALLHTRWDVVHAMTLNESNSLILPDTMHIWLVQEIMLSGGSVAFALQTMLTLLSSMAYYDTAAQFDAVAPADVSFFVVASVPLSWRGFIVVAVTMAAHLAITIALLIKFLWDTQFSRVGATWSALAQGSYGETEAWLAGAELASDQGVESSMETEGVTSVVVGLAAENGRVGIVKKVDKQDKGVTIAA